MLNLSIVLEVEMVTHILDVKYWPIFCNGIPLLEYENIDGTFYIVNGNVIACRENILSIISIC